MRKRELENQLRMKHNEIDRLEEAVRRQVERADSILEARREENLYSYAPTPIIDITGAAQIGAKFVCAGNLAAFPFNPYALDWPEFHVRFNDRTILVRVTDASEDWGWKAQDVESLKDEKRFSPKIDIRNGR